MPHSLLTFRKVESEKGLHKNKKLDWDFETATRGGIIGRLINGTVMKIFIAAKLGGAVPLHGEILDSTSYLAISLINVLHNFNMDSAQVVSQWMNTVMNQMEEIAITKHSFHIDEIRKMCEESEAYVLPFHSLLQDMMASTEETAARPKKRLRPGQKELILNREVKF